MGKITVKHYLNTNLKSYKINGEDYYSVYILITANRQNTKVKSIKFNELYTENDYKELIKENNPNLDLEVSSITNLSTIMINVLGNFDTSFFTLLYTSSEDKIINPIIESVNYIDMYLVFESNDNGAYELCLSDKELNKFNINITELFQKKQLKRDNADTMTVFYWFSNKVQIELLKVIKESKLKVDNHEVRDKINLYIFYSYLNDLSEIFKKKKTGLYDKYKLIFHKYDKFLNDFIIEYGKYHNGSKIYSYMQLIDKKSKVRNK